MLQHAKYVSSAMIKSQQAGVKKGFSPYARVFIPAENLVPGANGVWKTSVLRGGGPNCEFFEFNRIEIPVSSFRDANAAAVYIDAMQENLMDDDILGRGVLRLSRFNDRSEPPKFCDTVFLKEILNEDDRAANVKPSARGEIRISVHRTSDKYVIECWSFTNLVREDSELSASTRLLIYASVFIFLYFLVGTAVFTIGKQYMNDEISKGTLSQREIINGLYFAVVTATTVGYGDIVPESGGMKVFVAFYALIGVSLIGACLGIVAGSIAEFRFKLIPKAIGKREEDAQTSSTRRGLFFKWLAVFGFVFLGAVWFNQFENIPFASAFYSSMITITTVGYGDFAFHNDDPDHDGGRLFGIFFIIFGTVLLANALGSTIESILERKMDALAEARIDYIISPRLLSLMDTNRDGVVDEREFVRFMLKHVMRVSEQDVRLIKRKFRRIDRNHRGRLTIEDILPLPVPMAVPDRESTFAHRVRGATMDVSSPHLLEDGTGSVGMNTELEQKLEERLL